MSYGSVTTFTPSGRYPQGTQAYYQTRCPVWCADRDSNPGLRAVNPHVLTTRRPTHQSWFQPDEWVRKESWMLSLHAPERIRVMAQFRLGSHWLAVQQGRFARTPRHQRCCTHCPGQREDELHLLECPRYAELRSRYKIFTRHERMTDMHINEQFNKQEARVLGTMQTFEESGYSIGNSSMPL